ncbi:MAG: prepilin-type N-terminal cleavage/methylation domain-containing protein [Limisphaerales bacterium]
MKIPAAGRGFRRGFTLLDLLAVGCVLGIMGVLLFPAWIGMAADARTRLCAGNLSQVGRAMALYAADHDESFPGNQHSQPSWVRSLAAYCPTNSYRCPEEIVTEQIARSFTIALNDFFTPHPYGARELNFSSRTKVSAPAETFAFAEADPEFRAYDHFHFADARENGYQADTFAEQVDAERHGGAANYLFVDGHVDSLAWSSGAKPKLNYPTSRFVHPAGHMTSAELAGK